VAVKLAPGEYLVDRANWGMCDQAGNFIESIQLYEIVSEKEVDQETGLVAIKLAPDEYLVHRATCVMRDQAKTIQLYEIVSEKEVDQETGLTEDEKATCKEIIPLLASKFREYQKGVEKIKNRK